jgi:hypothetical protein
VNSNGKPPGSFGTAAYGGDNWSQRNASHAEEIGHIWAQCGIDSEWRNLQSVLLHSPGEELNASQDDHESVQMLDAVDLVKAREEHAAMVDAFRAAKVEVHFVEPDLPCQPNQMFCADLFVMTPQGAILARPASTVRAGEERWVARKLAALGIPLLATLTGNACFEGADLMWIDETTAMIRCRHAVRYHAFHGYAAHRRPRPCYLLAAPHSSSNRASAAGAGLHG